MCGIAGFLANRALAERDAAALRGMTDAISHRGPDDSGLWLDAAKGVGLGHRRLSIIDLSPAGHQPMASASGRYVVVYNGEIYNHKDLRAGLEADGAAPVWRGRSDTEVMLAAFERWGVPSTLSRLNGMFAFAVWDRDTETLTLARDRLGEKPLFYGLMGQSIIFGSELKALTAHPDFIREIDRDALALYLKYQYVPSPHCIWQGVRKLPAGHYIEIRDADTSASEPAAYWDFLAIASAGAAAPLPEGGDLADGLEVLLRDAVGRQMSADVPLGAFLSGGIDSSLIVALMQAQSERPIQTFTIGFKEPEYNEAEHAKAVASHLGTQHTELYVSADDALAVVPKLSAIWDEPFSDSSQIPTYLVSRLTRQSVTVSLSGDGGDELFGGYNRYTTAMRIWDHARHVPRPLRTMLGRVMTTPAAATAARAVAGVLPERVRPLGFVDRLPKVGRLLLEDSAEGMYQRLIAGGGEARELLRGDFDDHALAGWEATDWPDFRQFMMYADTLNYLPDDILVKVDRASMAVSLETRAPFLDYRVAEYAWRLPMSARIRNGVGKHIIREILERYVPRSLTDRPKMGFAMPVSSWLSGALRPWAESLLAADRLDREGLFDPIHVQSLWRDYLAGRTGLQDALWSILMFQAWWEENRPASPRGGLS